MTVVCRAWWHFFVSWRKCQGEQNEEWNPGYRASGAGLDKTSWSNAEFRKMHNAAQG